MGDINRNVYFDTVPHLPVAGKGFIASNPLDSTKGCMQPVARPTTPPEISKFRKSHRERPGVVVQHPGLVGAPLPPADFRFGRQGDRAEGGVKPLIGGKKPNRVVEAIHQQKEHTYASQKREPLGKSMVRGVALPAKASDPNFRFGKSSDQPDELEARSLIYHETHEEAKKVFFRKTQQTQQDEAEVTKPRNRGYDWSSTGKDPNNFRFGRPPGDAGLNNASKAVFGALDTSSNPTQIGQARAVQHRSLNGEPLGRTRPNRGTVRNLPADHTFGRPSDPADTFGTAQAIKGNFSLEEQLPDPDLGSTSKPARMRHQIPDAQTRRFGCASVRTDKKAPAVKSVGDVTNYGTDPTALGLITPNKFAFDGLTEADFIDQRDEQDIREIFEAIGQHYTDQQFGAIIDNVNQMFEGHLCVESFRGAVRQMRSQGILSR